MTTRKGLLQLDIEFSGLKYNANNSRCYADMVEDMKKLSNGVFSCTLKIDNGDIVDYLSLENESYAGRATQTTHQIPRR